MNGNTLAQTIAQVQERIAAALQRAGRRDSVTLVAVSKTVTLERIAEAYQAGLRDFGENYAQEFRSKAADSALNLPDLQWHFIGHLQTNKVRDVVGRVALIHSVDSVKLAQEIGKRALMLGTVAPILLEVKIDRDSLKTGFAPESVLNDAAQIDEIDGVDVRGLMGMAPYAAEPERARPAFRELFELYSQLPEQMRQICSMGMTGDFEVAIDEGSTLVRIGTGLFGQREPSAN
jgi:PLP dependent protein